MNYLALYRKYRPQSFADVIGQEHICTTLTNQIKLDRISHAYLFTGSRGTGKTSCAKIFAKAINCQKPNNGSPCGKCEVCIALDDPANLDIIEIDAASNNKVDEIRALRETVQYMPVKGRYKTYIIDEVHMLTDSAFNALLKTLEEPPKYVVFILATTEVHKLPATILSRCMRFDFHLVAQSLLENHIASIFDKEGKKFEPEAVKFIAQSAQGSVRDLLSIADMCINYSSSKLLYSEVLHILGASDKSVTAKLFNCIALSDIAGSLQIIDSLYNCGKSMSLISRDIIKYARDVLVVKTAGETLVTDTKENIQRLTNDSKQFSAEILSEIITQFSKIEPELRYSVSPRIVLETAIIRSCTLHSVDLNTLSQRINALEDKINSTLVQNVSFDSVNINASGVNDEKPSQNQNANKNFGQPTAGMDAKSIWGRLVTYFRKTGSMGLYSLLSSHNDVLIKDDKLVVMANGEKYLQFADPESILAINRALIEDGIMLKIDVIKNEDEIDMDKEIEKVRKLVGAGVGVQIIK